jgi:hypothetical protein
MIGAQPSASTAFIWLNKDVLALRKAPYKDLLAADKRR